MEGDGELTTGKRRGRRPHDPVLCVAPEQPHGGKVGHDRRSCRAPPLGGGRPAARRAHRPHPADHRRRRRPARGVLLPGLRPVEVLPLLQPDAGAVPARRGAVHPRRPRRPGGAGAAAPGPDDRGRALRRHQARRGRGGVPGRGPAPGAGHRAAAARAPGAGRPGAGRGAVHGRGAARQPADDPDLPRRRLPRRQRVRRGRAHPRVPDRRHGHRDRGDAQPRAPRRGRLHRAVLQPALGRDHRRQPAPGHDRPGAGAQPGDRRLHRAGLRRQPERLRGLGHAGVQDGR